MSTTSTIELTEAPGTRANEINSDIPVQDHEQSIGAVSITPKVDKKGTTTVIISTIAGVTFISSLTAGLITISLPTIAKDLAISEALLLWPMSIYSLTCGCTLILSGAVADVVGSRNMYLCGAFAQSVFTLACGLSRTSTQLIIFRAFAGIAISLCLPSAVSLTMAYFAAGKRRNLAFASMGSGQPIGFSLGLVVGGILNDSIGWQAGFYIAAGVNSILFIVALVGLPKIRLENRNMTRRLRNDIDWIGAFILSASLALLLYVFATWTASISKIRSAESISCLAIGGALLPAFVVWVRRQESLSRATLIKNSIWRNKAFTSICINVFLIWGSFNATEVFLTFLFQDVQGLSATAASIRFLPELTGLVTNILIGLYVHKVPVGWMLNTSFIVSATSPLLLAVMREGASYWEFEFPAVALVPIASDVLFTVSQLVITAQFNENTQALAGGVFNTVAQIGKSVGLALAALIASSVTADLSSSDASHEDKLLYGYRAAWWFTFSTTVACIFVTLIGLRNIGRVGIKRD